MLGKVLAIDDEAAILRALKTILGRAGYEVTSAESANEALSLLERGSYDCVITDAVMPDLSGYDLVKRLRGERKHASVPILMLTRKRHRQDVKNALEAGVTDYVLKPIDESLLLEKLSLCLRNANKEALREMAITGKASDAEICVACQLASLGETSLTLRTQYRLDSSVPFRLQSKVFSEIGILSPILKLESCEMMSFEDTPKYSWEAKASFGPLSEMDATRLREWIQRKKGSQ